MRANGYAPAAGLPGIPVGTVVLDRATGLRGVLQDAFPYEDPAAPPGAAGGAPVLAFLRPEGGGREWTTTPADVEVADPVRADPVRVTGSAEPSANA